MTEYWVSQGNKWCDICKIYIANNTLSVRTHELGQRHKDNVTKRLASMKKESAAKEKAEKDAAKALQQIEDKAKKSYQKDLAAFRKAKDSGQNTAGSCKGLPTKFSADWEYDAASGYYYNLASGCYYDSDSGLYYSNAIGKWVKQEETFPSSQVSKSGERSSLDKSSGAKPQSGQAPGLVISTPLNPLRSVKGAPSSIAPSKRKREDEKPKLISKEEATALKAREAARKRVEDREKNLLGLYSVYRPGA